MSPAADVRKPQPYGLAWWRGVGQVTATRFDYAWVLRMDPGVWKILLADSTGWIDARMTTYVTKAEALADLAAVCASFVGTDPAPTTMGP